MLGGRQTIFLTPYFQFEKRFDFLFVYVMNTCDYFLCLPSWLHGKRRKLSWKSHGILLSDFCGNPGKTGQGCSLTNCPTQDPMVAETSLIAHKDHLGEEMRG